MTKSYLLDKILTFIPLYAANFVGGIFLFAVTMKPGSPAPPLGERDRDPLVQLPIPTWKVARDLAPSLDEIPAVALLAPQLLGAVGWRERRNRRVWLVLAFPCSIKVATMVCSRAAVMCEILVVPELHATLFFRSRSAWVGCVETCCWERRTRTIATTSDQPEGE